LNCIIGPNSEVSEHLQQWRRTSLMNKTDIPFTHINPINVIFHEEQHLSTKVSQITHKEHDGTLWYVFNFHYVIIFSHEDGIIFEPLKLCIHHLFQLQNYYLNTIKV
jgi:hypothetical protein